jgi:hypothetical protein
MINRERNVVESITTIALTKAELIKAIEEAFPDETTNSRGTIAVLVKTELTDGTKNQTLTIGKTLNV